MSDVCLRQNAIEYRRFQRYSMQRVMRMVELVKDLVAMANLVEDPVTGRDNGGRDTRFGSSDP